MWAVSSRACIHIFGRYPLLGRGIIPLNPMEVNKMEYLSKQNRERMHEEMLRFGEASDKICSLLKRPKVRAAVRGDLRKHGLDKARAAQLAREASDSLCEATKSHWYQLFRIHGSNPEKWFADKLAATAAWQTPRLETSTANTARRRLTEYGT